MTQQAAYSRLLALQEPIFEDDGYITTAIMSAAKGIVELRCGPAEYNVELFVHESGKRWTLTELIALPGIREWMKANSIDLEGKLRVQAEVEYVFRLLNDALSQVSILTWLLR